MAVPVLFAMTLAAASCSRGTAVTPSSRPGNGTQTTERIEPGHHPLREIPHIAIECASGPIPASPGQSPVRIRALEIEQQGLVRRTVHRVDGTARTQNLPLTAQEVARIQALATEALNHAGLDAEAPVPDGTACTLRITRYETLELRLAYPTGHAPLQPLLDALVPLVRGE